jgi:hypothetical protein
MCLVRRVLCERVCVGCVVKRVCCLWVVIMWGVLCKCVWCLGCVADDGGVCVRGVHACVWPHV